MFHGSFQSVKGKHYPGMGAPLPILVLHGGKTKPNMSCHGMRDRKGFPGFGLVTNIFVAEVLLPHLLSSRREDGFFLFPVRRIKRTESRALSSTPHLILVHDLCHSCDHKEKKTSTPLRSLLAAPVWGDKLPSSSWRLFIDRMDFRRFLFAHREDPAKSNDLWTLMRVASVRKEIIKKETKKESAGKFLNIIVTLPLIFIVLAWSLCVLVNWANFRYALEKFTGDDGGEYDRVKRLAWISSFRRWIYFGKRKGNRKHSSFRSEYSWWNMYVGVFFCLFRRRGGLSDFLVFSLASIVWPA